ncbi:MAG: hypothetical protein IKU48_01365 [Clostridia bacterium]|nr:hypothetical protein [Clostridia bacterium]
MKRSINIWQFLGFATTSLSGTLLHFLYNWTGENKIAAFFSGVNESTWEHMKLLFWPMFLFAAFQSFFFKDIQSFWCVKLKGILLSVGLIPVIFYTYNGVIGKSPDWINISIFFICAAIGYVYETVLFKDEEKKCNYSRLAFAVLCIIALLFIVFTFVTPEIAVFKDPVTKTFGI